MRLIDLTGQRFGRWSVIRRERGGWLCRCDCGHEKVVAGGVLRGEKSKSCGCYRVDRGKEHGSKINLRHGEGGNGKESIEYRAWSAMHTRCNNPNHPSYKHYGAKGVKIDPSWASFETFLQDVGRRPGLKFSLDRIDRSKPYGPGNARWATSKVQNRNTSFNRVIRIGAESKPLQQWCEELGINRKTFYTRLKTGMTAEESLTLPVAKRAPPRGNVGLRNLWAQMKGRCSNPNSTNYSNYGGRGIKVCEQWATSFEAFVSDVGQRPSPTHSLDRIDPDGDYEPGNVRWATKKEQARNSRSNRRIEIGGESLTLSEWCAKLGTSKATFYARVRKGWAEADALVAPLVKPGRPRSSPG